MSILNKNVRRRGGDLFDELKSAGEQPLKIVPVRFPIAEETYEIVQVVNEPMGMVERYVLEAISEFGPCDYTDIHNLLGLDTELIGDMVEDLSKAGNIEVHSRTTAQEILADFPDLSSHQLYACGSVQMVQAAYPAFMQHGISSDDCFSDAFHLAPQRPLRATEAELVRLGGSHV